MGIPDQSKNEWPWKHVHMQIIYACMKQASFEADLAGVAELGVAELAGVAAFGDDTFLGAGLALAADRGVPDLVLLPTLGDGVDDCEPWLSWSSSINFIAISSFFCSTAALSEESCKPSYAKDPVPPFHHYFM